MPTPDPRAFGLKRGTLYRPVAVVVDVDHPHVLAASRNGKFAPAQFAGVGPGEFPAADAHHRIVENGSASDAHHG
jgi:hypothetical protein